MSKSSKTAIPSPFDIQKTERTGVAILMHWKRARPDL